MANFSPQNQTLEGLLGRVQPGRDGVFDPTLVEAIDLGEEGIEPAFLRGTVSKLFPEIGHYTVALFDLEGPKISREPTDRAKNVLHTENIIHRNCFRGILLRPDSVELLKAQYNAKTGELEHLVATKKVEPKFRSPVLPQFHRPTRRILPVASF
jgi:hypothetical protein